MRTVMCNGRVVRRVAQMALSLLLSALPAISARAQSAVTPPPGDGELVSQLIAALDDPDMAVRRDALDRLGTLRDPRAVEPILAHLTDSTASGSVRVSMVEALGALKDRRAVPQLLTLLTDGNFYVQQKAILSLVAIGDPSAVDPIASRLDDKDSEVRSAAAFALGMLRAGSAVPALLARSKDEDKDVRAAVAGALSDIGPPAVTTAMLLPFLSDPDSGVRRTAVAALGSTRDTQAVAPLTALLGDADTRVRTAVVAALGTLGDSSVSRAILKFLQDPDDDLRLETTRALGALKAVEAVPLLAARLTDTRRAVREAAEAALVSIADGRSTARIFTPQLSSPDADTRERAARILGQVKATEAIAPLLARIEDEERDVREAALEAVVAIGIDTAPEGVDRFLVRWKGSPDGDLTSELDTMREQMATAVAQSPRALRRLLTRLVDANGAINETAAQMLRLMPGGLALLVTLADDADAAVRRAAVAALGMSGDLNASATLVARLSEPDDNVREAAVVALGRLRPPEAVEWLADSASDPNPRVRRATMSSLASVLDASAAATLASHLNDPDVQVRDAAVLGLGQLRDARAAGPLVELLHHENAAYRARAAAFLGDLNAADSRTALARLVKDPRPEVRAAAAKSLGTIGQPDIAPQLRPLLGDADARVRAEAAFALGLLADTPSIPVLLKLVGDQSEDVRWLASGGLSAIGGPRVAEGLFAALPALDDDAKAPVIGALTKLGDERVIDLAIDALGQPRVRDRAAEVLRSLGDIRTVPRFLQALPRSSGDTRTVILQLLRSAEDPRILADPVASRILLDRLNDRDPEVRVDAISHLAGIGDSRVVAPIARLLRDPNADVRGAAIRGLWRLGDVTAAPALLEALAGNDNVNQDDVVSALLALNDRSVIPALLAMVRSLDPVKRLGAISALGALADARAVDSLIDLLKDPDEQTAWLAALSLGRTGDTRAVPPLIDLLRTSEFQVRSGAAIALGQLRDVRAAQPLLDALADGELSASGALVTLHAPQTVPSLVGLLRHPGVTTRALAASALGDFGDPQPVDALIEATTDRDEWVRREAVTALGKLRAAKAREAIVKALKDPDDDVREEAAEALEALADPAAITPLLASLADNPLEAEDALEKVMSPAAVDLLQPLLTATGYRVRRAAARLLGFTGTARAIPLLLTRLTDEHGEVRAAAMASLAQLKDPSAIGPLTLAGAQSDGDATAALAMRARLGDPTAMQPILQQMERDSTRYSDGLLEALIALSEHGVPLPPDARFRGSMRGAVGFALDGRSWIDSRLNRTTRYGSGLLPLIHDATALADRRVQSYVIRLLWEFDDEVRGRVDEARLDADEAALVARTAADALPSNANPLVQLFIARLHLTNGRHARALAAVDRALPLIPPFDTTTSILGRWLRAEALRRLGRSAEAIGEIEGVQRDLLPRLAPAERATDLPFDSYTGYLQGELLKSSGAGSSGQAGVFNPVLDAFNRAGAALDRERRQAWLSDIRADQIEYLLRGARAEILGPQQREDVQKAKAIAERVALPASAIFREKELALLRAELDNAVLDQDAARVHAVAEKLVLLSRVRPENVSSGDPARRGLLETFQALEQRARDTQRQFLAAETRRKSGEKAPPGENVDKLRTERRAADAALKAFVSTLKRDHPDFAALVAGEPADLAVARSHLADDELLVQYVVLEEKSYAIAADASSLEFYELGVGRTALREDVEAFRRAIEAHRPAAGADLGRLLLDPLRAHLRPPKKRLILVLNGPLHFLPFGALPFGQGFLIEQYTINVLSGTSVLQALSTRRPETAGTSILALGDPRRDGWSPLPSAAAEVSNIKKRFPQAEDHVGPDARRALLVGRDLSGHILHLAVHAAAGTVDDTRLILSDGDLTLRDVWALELQGAPLVVLSACETSLGQVLSGDEVASLAEGFMWGGGAKTVVSTLWSVDDARTSELLDAYYAARGGNESEALAAAQRAFIGRGHDPYYWAGFVVNGR